MAFYRVTNINPPLSPRRIEADGFYYEEGTGAVTFFNGDKGEDQETIARLYNVNVEPVGSAEPDPQ